MHISRIAEGNIVERWGQGDNLAWKGDSSMPAYIIGYDLNTPGKDYEDLSEAIKGYGTWWHHLDSTWIIVTDQTHVEVRDHLWRFMDDNDELLVAQLAGNAAWRGFSDEGARWLAGTLA
jgi:hypothetical protein